MSNFRNMSQRNVYISLAIGLTLSTVQPNPGRFFRRTVFLRGTSGLCRTSYSPPQAKENGLCSDYFLEASKSVIIAHRRTPMFASHKKRERNRSWSSQLFSSFPSLTVSSEPKYGTHAGKECVHGISFALCLLGRRKG